MSAIKFVSSILFLIAPHSREKDIIFSADTFDSKVKALILTPEYNRNCLL